MLPREQERSSEIRFKLGPLLKHSDNVVNLTIELLRAALKSKATFSKTESAILALSTKACKTFRSMNVLADHAFGDDVLALLRVLTETCINIAYICKEERDKRADQFLAFAITRDERMVRLARKDPSWQKVYTPELCETIMSRCRQIRKEFELPREKKYDSTLASVFKQCCPPIVWSGIEKMKLRRSKAKKSWWLEDTRRRAARAEMKNLYVIGFAFASQTVHGTDLGGYLFADASSSGAAVLNLEPDARWIPPAIPTAIIAMFKVLLCVNELFEVGFDQKIQDVMNQHRELMTT